MSEPLFKQVTIIGVGLLGGSLGMAVQKHGLTEKVVGFARNASTIEEARRLEAITSGTTELAKAIEGSDLIVFCTPVRHIQEVLPEVMANTAPGAIITDVGSTKASIVEAGDSAQANSQAFFVGSHPMAGSEKSGVHHSREDLFANSTCFVTRTPNTNLNAFLKVSALWRSIGCRLVICRPERHDRLAATVSHLPHLAAVALVHAVESFNEDKNLIKGIIGNGFRDTTRIAAGDSRMWEDICTDNRLSIEIARTALDKSLADILRACHPGSCEQLRDLLEGAAEYREFLDEK